MPGNYRRLNENIRLNGLAATIDAVNIAMGRENGQVCMAACEGAEQGTGNAVVQNGSAAGKASAPVRLARLDDLAAELNIQKCDFIKVDIEGFELNFFNGGLSFIGRHRPVISTELNFPWMETFGWDVKMLRETLEPLGYSLYKKNGKKYTPYSGSGGGIEQALLIPENTPCAVLAREYLC